MDDRKLAVNGLSPRENSPDKSPRAGRTAFCPVDLGTARIANAHQEMAASTLTVRFLFMAELAARIGAAGHAGLIRLQATASDLWFAGCQASG